MPSGMKWYERKWDMFCTPQISMCVCVCVCACACVTVVLLTRCLKIYIK